LIAPELAVELLAAAKRYHDLGHWWCELFLLMPDHLHAILAFPTSPGMSHVIRQWTRGTARFQRVRWQDGYFDHRLRNDHEYAEKWSYILRNPIAKSLCTSENEWPWRWSGLTSRRLP
jgi:REP element-mobilizing transposase RayT